LIEARNTGDSLIYQTEKFMRELGDNVSDTDRSQIEQTISELKEAMNSEDAARINQAIEQLRHASMALGQQMYAQQQTAGGPAGEPDAGPGPEPTSDDDDDVIEGEFQET
jgi:molecular chaperone DnaK